MHVQMEGNAAAQEEATSAVSVKKDGRTQMVVVGLQGSQPRRSKVVRTRTGP